MNRKLVTAITLLVFAVAALMPAGTVWGASTKAKAGGSAYYDTKDVDAWLKARFNDADKQAADERKVRKNAGEISLDEASGEEAANEGNFTFNGGTKVFVDYESSFVPFTLRSIGDKVEVWVANDLSFPEGDSRPAHVITQAQVDRMVEVFDDTVYAKDTEFFGTPDSHSGENAQLSEWGYVPDNYYVSDDGSDRIIILVDNVKDEQYYDPTYPFFVAGFYSPSFEGYTDRNILTIDSKDWATRLENTYLPTEAHEFQHLIHDDNDSEEEAWINEGMSDFAEYLCFGEQPWDHIQFFLDHPENSLVSWDDQLNTETGPETLADYGQAYLVQLYLSEQYGEEFIRTLAKDKDHGIASMNKILDEFNTGIDFTELFRRFTIAVAIDSPQPGNGIYNFNSIDLNVNYQSALAFDKDGVPAWGGDYKQLDHANKIQSVKIDGVEYLPSPWKVVNDPLRSGGKVLWGNSGNELANRLIFKADLRNQTAATLQFDNYYDIEEQWDFGIVQVSTDNGATWTSLSNANTRSDIVDEGYPAIKASLPGFTGTNKGWAKEKFDLTPFAGEEILLCFNYMTDWGSNGAGWYIDNIEIPEIGLKNDGSNLNETYTMDQILDNKANIVHYAVTFINKKALGKGNTKPNYRVLSVDPFNITEAEALQLKDFFSGGDNYAIIWYAAPIGITGVADYNYQITDKSEYNKSKNKKK